jgi:hypothetical protein
MDKELVVVRTSHYYLDNLQPYQVTYDVCTNRSDVDVAIANRQGKGRKIEVLECSIKHITEPEVKVYW